LVAELATALEVIADGGTITVQVLNEFTSVARQQRKRDWPEIERAIAVIRAQFPDIAPLTAETMRARSCSHAVMAFSFYDALIVAAAIETGCDTL
jgi:predicted nucleic acid-binding protein